MCTFYVIKGDKLYKTKATNISIGQHFRIRKDNRFLKIDGSIDLVMTIEPYVDKSTGEIVFRARAIINLDSWWESNSEVL